MVSLSNIKMRSKLMLMLVLPVAGMLYFSVASLISSTQSKVEMSRLQQNMVLAGKISAMVHEIQKERGMSAGYLGSQGKKFASELITQRNLADKNIADLKKFLESFDDSGLKGPLENASATLSSIVNLRSKISNLNADVGEVLTSYTSVNAAYLNVIGQIANASPDGNTARMASAYHNFLQSKERAGIERAILTNTFANHKFGSGMYQKFFNLVSAQNLFEGQFIGLATDDMGVLYRNMMDSPIISETERMRNIAFSSASLGDSVLSVDANMWFSRQTDKINLMKKVDDGLADILITYANNKKSAAQMALVVSALISIFSLLAAIVATYFIQKNIITRLTSAERVVEAVAKGDLTAEVTGEEGNDEIAHLLQSTKNMSDKLTSIVGSVQTHSGEIHHASNEIAIGNTELSQRTEEQASSLEETASSMEEMTSTVKQNADNALQAKQLSNSARELATKGGDVVSQAIGAMENIDDSSKKIADIIGVINDIAFQTNLLALNAAVEAARAGEQGRGFAVVATEVRNLAKRSATAAKEIKDLIHDSVDKVKVGSKLVDKSGETLAEIVGAVKKVSDIVAEITTASSEQSVGIEQVSQAIMQMDSITQQNAALVEESAAASKSLEHRAADLEQVISYFRLNSANTSRERHQTSRARRAEVHEFAKAHEKKVEEKKQYKRPLYGSDKTGTDDGDWSEF